jgi:putative membrane protein
VAGGTAALADGTSELAAGSRELADGTATLADGAAQLPDGLRELTGTADRAGQRTATTEAVLAVGATLAEDASGDAATITTVLTAAGSDPLPLTVWLVGVALLALLGSAGWALWRRGRVAA